MHYRRRTWGNAYGMIEYLMERAVEGLDPYKEYTFAEILKEGGICGDQSYFCVNTARAQGIPAMILSGETDLGGHAWVGMKIDSRRMDHRHRPRRRRFQRTDRQSANRRERSPSRKSSLWNDRHHQQPGHHSGRLAAPLAGGLFFRDGKRRRPCRHHPPRQSARPLVSRNLDGLVFPAREPDTTHRRTRRSPNNLDEWKNFAKDMRRNSKTIPRMAELAANAELEYIFPYGSEGDATRTLLRERRRIERDSGEQTDLIASSLKREAELISKRGDPDAKRDISRLYDRALRDYGGSITGFKMMADRLLRLFQRRPGTRPQGRSRYRTRLQTRGGNRNQGLVPRQHRILDLQDDLRLLPHGRRSRPRGDAGETLRSPAPPRETQRALTIRRAGAIVRWIFQGRTRTLVLPGASTSPSEERMKKPTKEP